MKNIRLPIPIFTNPPVKECEILKPTTGVIMETRKIVDTGNHFLALKKFLSGSLLIGDNPERTKRLVGELSLQSAEYLATQIMLLQYPDDDGVEGVYNCPRCGTQKICEIKDDIDTRDFINDLEIVYYEEDEEIPITKDIDVELINKKNGNTILQVNSLSLRRPLLKDYIEQANKHGYNNEVDIQKAVYVSCITHLNGNEIEREEKKLYGTKIIEKMNPHDLNYFAKEILKYGMQSDIEKVCIKCGKEWKTKINTLNFFVSALQ